MNAIVFRFSLVVGVMDALTGAALVGAPGMFLRLAGINLPGGEAATILLRWIGVFVASVGLSYLWAIGARDHEVRRRRLPGVWGTTAIVRASVAIFSGIAVIAAQLQPVWLLVTCIDGAIAIVQTIGAHRGWMRV